MIDNLSEQCKTLAEELQGQAAPLTPSQRARVESLLMRAGNRLHFFKLKRARWLDERLPKTKGPNRGDA
jgi:hypothetical protein